MTATRIVIASGARTAVGAFNGAFAEVPAHRLGAKVIEAALLRAGVGADEVDEVILGQVLTAGQGQNPARQAAMAAAIPHERTAWGVNQLCGSGLRAVALGMQQIATGDARIVVSGGQENMSLAPHAAHLRSGRRMGNAVFADTMVVDGLWDAFNDFHMGNTAENLAKQWRISREEQDVFAQRSQSRAESARDAGWFRDEIVPVAVAGRKGEIIVKDDEQIRPGTTIESLGRPEARLRQDRHGNSREYVRHQRRRRCPRPHDGGGRVASRHHATSPHCLLGHRRCGSRDHGHRAHSRLPPRAAACRMACGGS